MADGEGFVGRQDELGLLGRCLTDAVAGRGSIILITGPAGIGKTRLVEEFLAAVDMPAGWGAAIADPGMPPLWPWARALRRWPGPAAALASVVAGDTQHSYGSAEDAAATTFAGDTRVLDEIEEQARADGAMLVVLDDLHWADRPTLRLLERTASEVRRLPLLLIGTSRQNVELRRSAETEQVHLGPLRPEDARGFLSLAVDRADPEAVRHAAELSGGSPLYLRTLSRVAIDQLRGRGTWDSAVGAAPEFRNLVSASLRSAGADAAACVGALSVLGRRRISSCSPA